MIDIKLIIDRPDWVQDQYDRKGFKVSIRMLRDAMIYQRMRKGKIESLQSMTNKISKEIGALKKRGEPVESLIRDAENLNGEIDFMNEITRYISLLLSYLKKESFHGK